MSTIQFPYMRREVVLALGSLADIEHQTTVWLSKEPPKNYDNLDYVVHILYDDMGALPEPRQYVQAVFFDGPEIPRLERLGQLFSAVLADNGSTDDMERYLRDPRWPKIVELAGSALAAMVRAGGYCRADDVAGEE